MIEFIIVILSLLAITMIAVIGIGFVTTSSVRAEIPHYEYNPNLTKFANRLFYLLSKIEEMQVFIDLLCDCKSMCLDRAITTEEGELLYKYRKAKK